MQLLGRGTKKTETSIRLSLPIELHKLLQEKAAGNRRSLREELIRRLTSSLKYEDVWMETDQLMRRIFKSPTKNS